MFGEVVMEDQKRMRPDTKLHPPDTSLDMLKRVLAVAELVAKSKQSPEDKQQSAPESCEKTQIVRPGVS
jgi:hypothetical protein